MPMRLALTFILLAAWALPAAATDAQKLCGSEVTPCLKYGVSVFQTRCTLCHGSDGLGEGNIPLSVPGYPATNLLKPRHPVDYATVRKVIAEGARMKGVGPFMPPWADELTLTQLDSVAQFVVYLRKNSEAARLLLRTEAADQKPTFQVGRAVYLGRCAMCHGKEGGADGRMAAVIKDPPPANLKLSRVPDDYLRLIIAKGGGAVQRSPRMPPWGEDLSKSELESVILHLKTLRD
jgi:cytochrome c oxidase cbb3-type subunit 3